MHVRILLTNYLNRTLFYKRQLLLMVLLFLCSLGVHAQNAYTEAGLPAPIVTSDKDDYAPGEVATITGTGWTKDQQVHVEFKEEPDYPDYHIYDVTVDSTGRWEIKYDIEQRHLGVKFTVIAVGKQSGVKSTHVFTDGRSDFTVSFSSNINCINSSKEYTVTFNNISNDPNPSQNRNIGNILIDGFDYTISNITVSPSNWSINTSDSKKIQVFAGNNTNTIKPGSSITIKYTYSHNSSSPENKQWNFTVKAGFASVGDGNTFTHTNTSNVAITSNANKHNISFSAQPTATAGQDQTVNGTTTSLVGNTPASGTTGEWSIISGTNGILASPSSYNSAFSGETGQTYILRWTVTNSGCSVSDDVQIKFNSNPVPILSSIFPSIKNVGDAAFTLTATGSNFIDGSIIYYNGSARTTTFVSGTELSANIPASDLTTAGVKKITVVTPSPGGGISNEVDFTVNRAQPVISWGATEEITYGTSLVGKLNATASYGGDPVAGTFVYKANEVIVTNSTILNAKSTPYTLTVDFTPTDAINFNTASSTNALKVNKAASVTTVTITGAPFYYTGAAIEPATVSVTGAGGLNLTPNAAYADNINSGTATASYVYAGDVNHFGSEDSESFMIGKAATTVTLANLSQTYDGTGKAVTASTDAAGTSSFVITYDGSAQLPVNHKSGGYAVVATLVNDNYEGSSTGTLQINKADQVISWAASEAITYGTILSNTQLNAIALGGAALTYLPAAGTMLNAGTHTLKVTAAETSNYNEGSEEISITVNKATATLTLSNLTHTYDGIEKLATVTTDPEDLSGVSISNNGKINAGTYEVIASLDNSNYEAVPVTGNLVIRKAAATLTLGNLNHTYDGTLKSATATAVPAVSGVSVSGSGTNAGEYNASASLDNPNYESTPIQGTLVIDKAALTIKADNATKVYGAAMPSLSGSIVSGAVEGEAFEVTATTAATASSSVGDYDIIPSVTGTTLDNYEVTATKGKLTISPKAITVTPAVGQGKVYGTADPALTYSSTALVGSDTFMGALAREAGSNVGAYTINQGSLALNSNYTLNVEEGVKFNITPKPVTASINASDKVYDGTTTASATGSVPANDLIGNDAVTVLVSDAAFANKNVGTWNVTAGVALSGAAAGNYSLTNLTATSSATITAKPLTASIVALNKVYDGLTAASATGNVAAAELVNGESLGVEVSNAHFDNKNVGSGKTVTANVALQGAQAGNYNLQNSTATTIANITAKELSASITASDKVYDGNSIASVEASVVGIVEGDKVALNASNASFNDKNVGTGKPVSASISISGLDATNYTVNTTASANAAITPKLITITAAAKTKVYGDVDPVLTYTITSGNLVEGEALVGNLNRDAGENAGTYAINQSTLTAGSNYNLSYQGANLVISSRPITVAANAVSKTYGDTDPALTYQVTSGALVGADSFSGALSRVIGENVGNYTINKNTLSAGINYNLSYVGANLTINARPVTVTADNQSKYCGQADPTLTYKITNGNLISTDNFSGALTRTSGENSGGSYSITQGSLDLGSNYVLTYVPANLSILGVSIDASASGNPVPIGSTALLSASVMPAVAGISITFKLDGVIKGTVVTGNDGRATLSVSGLTVNVYQVEAVAGSGCVSSTAYLPVYDPNGGFVTGGGWINSPKGASALYPEAEGKANFGFVAKYKKGSTAVEGETEFMFEAGNMKFKSTSYESATLVISGAKASYRGVGTINGTGNYKFTLTAIDGQVTGGGGADKIRMKIVNADGNVVYDNQGSSADNADPTMALGGGSIVIHNPNSKSTTTTKSTVIAAAPQSESGKFYNYPNTFTDRTTIAFSLEKSESYLLEVYDMRGVLIKKVDMGVAEADKLYEFEFNGSHLSKGMYIARLLTPSGAKSVKMILNK